MLNTNFARRLMKLCRQLGLNPTDTAKLLASYYVSRRPILKRLCHRESVLIGFDAGRKHLRLPLRTNGTDYELLEEIFVQKVYELKAEGVRTILDLGANIGFAAAFFSTRFPEAEIACVEPFAGNLSLLRNALDLNEVRARVFEAAIGSADGGVIFHVAENPVDGSVLPRPGCLSTVTVRQMSVPSLLRELKWDHVDVLKIDIEGAEKSLLKENNAWLESVRFIVGETHAIAQYPWEELERDLKCFGFLPERRSNNEYGSTIFSATRATAARRVDA